MIFCLIVNPGMPHCKDKSVPPVQGNGVCLMWESYSRN